MEIKAPCKDQGTVLKEPTKAFAGLIDTRRIKEFWAARDGVAWPGMGCLACQV